jgi:hypothetical protein
VGQHLALPNDKDVGDHRIALGLLVEHALEAHQVIEQDLVGGVQGH